MNRQGLDGVSLQLPSTVFDKKFIRIPNVDSVVESDDEWRRCGKWLIGVSEDVLDLDEAWMQLQGLIDDGTLLMIKSSTARMAKREAGVIMCYTRPRKSEIKRAADAIRGKIRLAYVMFYKTNERSEREWDESSVKTQYMYTSMGRFYERDEHGRWILVKDEDENGTEISAESHESDKKQPGISLTSVFTNFEERFELVHPGFENSKLGHWAVYCDFTHADENGLTELDKVQTAAKELFEKGVFSKIIRVKLPYDLAKVNFYVTQCEDKIDILKFALELRKAVSHPYFLKFQEDNSKRIKFMHTPEGEFIECIPTKTALYLLKTLPINIES